MVADTTRYPCVSLSHFVPLRCASTCVPLACYSTHLHTFHAGANILVDNDGTIKLADFGASKKLADLATISEGFKSIKGTPYWMAPEVIKQTGHGRQADIWSVGCTVIEMATGEPPWSQFSSQVRDTK